MTAATSTATTTITNGTVVQSPNNNLDLASLTIATNGTFTKASGAGLLFFEDPVDPVFIQDDDENNNLGDVYIGYSPAVTNQKSDMVVDSFTVNSGDTHNTKGYEIDSATFIDVSGILNATDGGGGSEGDLTNIFVGTDWTIQSGGTFTHGNSTTTFDGTTEGNTITTQGTGNPFYTIYVDGSGGEWTFASGDHDIDHDFTINQGTVTSTNGTLQVGGSWTNSGTFDSNLGAVVFNSTDVGETINPGSSSFFVVTFSNPAGGWTVTNDATSTSHWNLSTANTFVVNSNIRIEVQGTFNNDVAGTATTWNSGSVIYLNLGSNLSYSINDKTTEDIYETIQLGANTDIRMWNSTSTTYTVPSSSSLYSMDHDTDGNGTGDNGQLYIWGDYHVPAETTDYWSYAFDFDGTDLTGSERQVNVRLAPNSTTTLNSGETLNATGTDIATTTINVQDTGTYAFRIDGGTTTFQYYSFRNLDESGLQLLGTTTVTSLDNGDFELNVEGGTMITISSTTIDADAAKSISTVRFSTSTILTTAYNVTETGTPTSYWTFTGHYGNYDGEDYDNDPGDPLGYIRWDGLGITISGIIYSDEGTSPYNCAGTALTVNAKVNGTGGNSAICTAGGGTYSISGVSISAANDVITIFLDNETENAVVITKASSTDDNITGLDIYQDRIIVRHEDSPATAVTMMDMDQYDADDETDGDIQYQVTPGASTSTTVFAGNKLYVWEYDTFIASTTLIVSGDSSAMPDGDLHLSTSSTLVAGGNITLAGNWIASTSATFTHNNSTTTFNATTTGKGIWPNTQSFYNIALNGSSGEWTPQAIITADNDFTIKDGNFDNNAYTHVITGNFLKSGGILTMNSESDRLDIAGNFTATGGTVDISVGSRIYIENDVSISGDNSFDPTYVALWMDGASNATITVSGANNDIVSYFYVSKDNVSYTVAAGSDFRIHHFLHEAGTFDLNGYNVTSTGVYYGYSQAKLIMDSGGTYKVGDDGYSGAEYSPWWVQSGWTEDISSGTIQVYGGKHATYGTAYFSDGSVFTPTGGTFQLMGTDASSSVYIAETDAADFNFWNLVLGDGTNTKTYEIASSSQTCDVNGDVTVNNNAIFASNAVPIEVAGNWANNGTFAAATGTVTFDATDAGHTIIDGGSAFYNLTFDGVGGTWLYQDGTSTEPNQTTVANGTSTFFNAKTGPYPSVTGGELNVDWYLGAHAVDAVTPATNIDTGDNDITISNSGWYGESWGYRKKIIIDADKIDESLRDFVILASTTDADLSSKAQTSGNDILFTKADGITKLNHEIENYDNSNGELFAWVNVPYISSSTDTEIYMYYGNTIAGDQQNASSTWDTSYKGVWHFDTDDYSDSSGYGYNGVNTDFTNTDGQIAGGKYSDGVGGNNNIHFGDEDDFSFGDGTEDTQFTFSFWYKAAVEGTNNYIFQKFAAGGTHEYWVTHGQFNQLEALLYGQNSTGNYIKARTPNDSLMIADGWQFIHVTYDGSEDSSGIGMYIDGTNARNGNFSGGTYVAMNNQTATLKFALYNISGYADEVRISNARRSPAWIKAEFENQGSPSTFYSMDSEQASSTIAGTVWKYDENSWGVPSSSTTTGSGADGKIPEPGTTGAIRIREYSRTSSATTTYKYNLQIDWQTNYGEYDYFDDYGYNYLTSASSTESIGVDKTISDSWHRTASSTMNDPYVCNEGSGNNCINNAPTNGSWYIGMYSALVFEITSGLYEGLGTLEASNNWTAEASSTLRVTTSASNGYVVTAWATNDGRLKLDNYSIYIEDYNAVNSAPREWNQTCTQNSNCCGFGYTTDDNDLYGGQANRFAISTTTCTGDTASGVSAYAGFLGSGPGDPVADSTSPTTTDETIVSYKVSTDAVQGAGNYQTTVIYVATANY
jgi:hypothetical protein